jgi:hypothetical protein
LNFDLPDHLKAVSDNHFQYVSVVGLHGISDYQQFPLLRRHGWFDAASFFQSPIFFTGIGEFVKTWARISHTGNASLSLKGHEFASGPGEFQ